MKWFRKKKENSITVNVEIDYEKLGNSVADSIVKREREEAERYSVTREWLKFIMQPMIILFGIIMALFSVYLIYRVYISLSIALEDLNAINLQELIKALAFFVSMLFTAGFSLMAFFANHELGKEKNRQFISSLFSNVVALVALIVALIALFNDIL